MVENIVGHNLQMVENIVGGTAIENRAHVNGVEKKECVALKLLGLLKMDVMVHLVA